MAKPVAKSSARKAAAAAVTSEDLLERFKDFPAIDAISRRFENPNDPGSLPILLKDEDPHSCVNSEHQNRLRSGATTCHLCRRPVRKYQVRWFNLSQEGRKGQMRSKGYMGVRVSELSDADDVSDMYRSKEDEYVRRGDNGKELLGKMPLEIYMEIKRRQQEERSKRASSKRHLLSDLAESAGRELGSEAGDMIHDGEITVESMSRSKGNMRDEGQRSRVDGIIMGEDA